MKMRGIGLVWFGTKIIRMMVGIMDLLRACPLIQLTLWLGKPGAQIGPPLIFVPRIERARIECPQRVTANALLVFKNQAEFRLVREIRADIDSAQRVGVFAVKLFAILAVVSGLQAYIVGPGLIAR